MTSDLRPIFESIRDLDYVVLRHFHHLPHNHNTRGDIDILTNDRQLWVDTTDADHHRDGIRYYTPGGIAWDVREVGDGYFDARWQRAVLDRATWLDTGQPTSIVRIPHHADAWWTLLYHAIVHKPSHDPYWPALDRLSQMQTNRARSTGPRELLEWYMARHGYAYTQPNPDWDYQNPTIPYGLRVARPRLGSTHNLPRGRRNDLKTTPRVVRPQ